MTLGRLKNYVLELTIRAVPTEVSAHFPSSLPSTTVNWSEVVSAYLLKHVQQEGKQTSLWPWNVKKRQTEGQMFVGGRWVIGRSEQWKCPHCHVLVTIIQGPPTGASGSRMVSLWRLHDHKNHDNRGYMGKGVTSEEIADIAEYAEGLACAPVRSIAQHLNHQRGTCAGGREVLSRQVTNAKPNARNQGKNSRALIQKHVQGIRSVRALHWKGTSRTPATVSSFIVDPSRNFSYLAAGRTQNTVDGLRAAVRYIRALPRHKQRHVELDSEKDGDDLRWCVTFTSTARLQVLYAAQQSPYWGSPSLSIDGTHSPCQLSNVIALTSMVKDMGGSCTLVGIALASAESAWAVNKFKQHLQSLVRKNVAKPGLPFTLRGMYTTHDGGLALFASAVAMKQYSLDDPRHLYVNVFASLNAVQKSLLRKSRNHSLVPADQVKMRYVRPPTSHL